jgi:hypothetical protein
LCFAKLHGMLIRDVVGFILGNIQLPLFIVAICTTISKLHKAAARHEVVTFSYTFWGEILFYCVGLGFIWFWYFHAYQAQFAATLIGWRPSPFEWELAWGQLGIALVALLSLWRGYDMRLAATLAFAVLALGSAAQHIHLMATRHNDAAGNAGLVLWFGEVALPIITLVLALASRDAYERTMDRSRV